MNSTDSSETRVASFPSSAWERTVEKLRFESCRGREAELRDRRSQTEFGNEGLGRMPTRRDALARLGSGFGLLALGGLLAEGARGGASSALAVKPPHHPARAKHVIFLFMDGGPSQLDLLDPKPRLISDHGKPLPFEKPKLARTTTGNLMAPPFRFRKSGRAGIEVSELLPHLGSCIDDICVVRSLHADNINHPTACLQMMTGEQVFSRPSLGAWVLYGLGSANRNLPGFVAVCAGGQDAALWGSSFLPAAYQGTRIADL